MPKLVEGYTEPGCSKLKNWEGFLKPNFRTGPNNQPVDFVYELPFRYTQACTCWPGK